MTIIKMQEIMLECPLNSLGYGRVGQELIPQLRMLKAKVYLSPIGQIDGEVNSHIKWALDNMQDYSPRANIPIVKIWHQHDMVPRTPTNGKVYGFPFFELDTFHPQEIDSLNRVNVLNASKWASSILNKNNIKTNTGKVIPLGYNKQIFYPENKSAKPFKVFNMGKWEIRKGHDVIPEIFKAAFKPTDDVELHMCCTNPFYSTEENKKWEDFYLSELKDYKVVIHPRLPNHDSVAQFIRDKHCGLFPTRAEGWNLEALEALACGLPIVATDYSAHTEFIPEEYRVGKSDYLVPAFDGKWFLGQGNWLEHEDLTVFSNKLREIYEGKIPNVSNKAWKYTWKYSAEKLLEAVR